MQKLDGFLPLYWDEAEGRLYLEIARFGVELLALNGFASGLGSNDIGLDRGELAGSRIVFFERVGPKVMMVESNYDFRASSTNPEEVKAVRDAFARSVLWGFSVAAESGGRVLVDATDWLLRDDLNLAGRLRPGSYKLDEKRSSLVPCGHLRLPEQHRDRGRADLRAAAAVGAAAGRRRAGIRPRLRRRRFFEAWVTSPRARKSRACASTSRSSSCRTRRIGRAPTIRAPASSRSRTRTTRRRSTSRSYGA